MDDAVGFGKTNSICPMGWTALCTVWISFDKFRFDKFLQNKMCESILLGILGGGVPPGSPNPDPISDQKRREKPTRWGGTYL